MKYLRRGCPKGWQQFVLMLLCILRCVENDVVSTVPSSGRFVSSPLINLLCDNLRDLVMGAYNSAGRRRGMRHLRSCVSGQHYFVHGPVSGRHFFPAPHAPHLRRATWIERLASTAGRRAHDSGRRKTYARSMPRSAHKLAVFDSCTSMEIPIAHVARLIFAKNTFRVGGMECIGLFSSGRCMMLRNFS